MVTARRAVAGAVQRERPRKRKPRKTAPTERADVTADVGATYHHQRSSLGEVLPMIGISITSTSGIDSPPCNGRSKYDLYPFRHAGLRRDAAMSTSTDAPALAVAAKVTPTAEKASP